MQIVSEMEFQLQVLQDQRQHVLDQFQAAAQQWTQLQQDFQTNFVTMKRAFEGAELQATKLETSNRIGELDLLLQQLNFQRAWIDTKIHNLKSGEETLTTPQRDQLKVKQQALEMQFLQNFPVLGKRFLRKLRKLLKRNHMTVQSNFDACPQVNGLPKPSFSKLKRSVRRNHEVTPTKNYKDILDLLQKHPALDRLKNKHGDFDTPTFSKEAVEELVGVKVSFMTLTKVQKGLQLQKKKIKKRKRKAERREGL